jgi:glycosyltransferase involved in cell wall biosynthesis
VQGRVLHLLATNQRRGAETFAVGLAAQLDGLGWSNELIALRSGAASEALTVEVAGRGRLDPLGVARIARRANASDAVIAHGASGLLVGALVHRLTRRPWVYRNIGDPAAWGQVRAADLRIGRPLRAATAIVSLYDTAANHLVAAYGVGPGRIRVIPNAADATSFTPPDAAARQGARRALGLDDRQWVLFIGALSEEKQPLVAIELIRRRPHIGLLIVGDGPLRDEVSRAAARAPDGTIRVVGTLRDPSPAYQAADVLLMTSRTEGMPAVALEASMSGLPVVATDAGALPEIVAAAGVGASVPEAELGPALDAVLGAPANPDRAAIVERYSWPAVARGWSDVLHAVTSERRRNR